ncbi:MAG: hypothetical protein EI684_23490 [Candidatus Viridilinea halotolerans]|uniref:Uncharacterized protein n=1 Tax=Candidatus Viridilinea halotolerans TaxID=2491704 RepID=A0A426TQ58_9CHLR|nr:MAG: hypothetical protein EI684_23490 [Candidatus Viridilinea halotolerans]
MSRACATGLRDSPCRPSAQAGWPQQNGCVAGCRPTGSNPPAPDREQAHSTSAQPTSAHSTSAQPTSAQPTSAQPTSALASDLQAGQPSLAENSKDSSQPARHLRVV